MTTGEVMDVLRQMLLVCVQLAGPILLVSIAIGLVVAIFQAATQIHEQTLTFVPKLLFIALTLLLLGGWISTNLIDFTTYVFALMEAV